MPLVIRYAELGPETPEETGARLERLRALREDGDPFAHRVKIGTYPCRCGARMDAFDGDPRARGWIRLECPSCGEWGDAEPDNRQAIERGSQ